MKKTPLIITLSVLLLVLFVAIRGCRNNRKELKQTTEYLSLTEQRFKEFKTKSDLNAAQASQQILSLEALLIIKKNEIARLVKELGLKPKRIKELVEVTIEGKDSVILKRDTLYYPSTPESPPMTAPFVYEDKWNSFQAFVDGDQIGLLYAITDSISIVRTREKGGTKISALSSNPAIRITGLSEIKVEDKKVGRFGVGPSLTVGYTNKVVVVPGIGIQWSLFRF